MSEQMELFRTLEKDLNFELAPCDRNFDLDAKSGLTKLELTPAKKGRLAHCFLKCRQCLQAKLWLTPMY